MAGNSPRLVVRQLVAEVAVSGGTGGADDGDALRHIAPRYALIEPDKAFLCKPLAQFAQTSFGIAYGV